MTEQLPVDERHLYSEGYLNDSLAIRLGGRAAELLVFGEGSTGAATDLAGATDLATRMVREFGMSKELGPIGEGRSVLPERAVRSYRQASRNIPYRGSLERRSGRWSGSRSA